MDKKQSHANLLKTRKKDGYVLWGGQKNAKKKEGDPENKGSGKECKHRLITND